MKRTIPTLAVLMAATLFTAAAQAQSARGAAAWPPGPTGEATAYPPGPTGQAGTQPTNVNVVNAPTVQVGNEVTVKAPVQTPFFVQKVVKLPNGASYGPFLDVPTPAGTRMVIETISLACSSSSPQPVAADIHRPGMTSSMLTLVPPPIAWGTASFSAQTTAVRYLVDDSLSVIVYRPTANGSTDCAVTFAGYTTPLP